MGKELAAAAVTALDLIQDQDSATRGAGLADSVHVFIGRDLDTSNSLDAFYYKGSHITLGKLGLCSLQVSPRQIGHMTASVDGSYDLGVIGHLDSQ